MSDLRAYRGDDASFECRVFERDGRTPQNVTDYSFRATIKLRRSDDDADALWQGTFTPPNDGDGIAVPDAEGGIVTFTVPKGVTTDLEGVFEWDLEATTAGGDVRTVDSGKLFMLADVSR